jgi:shikimate kinase
VSRAGTGTSTSVDGRHIVLVGLMGTGKSSAGRPLAQALGRTFVDNDSELTARTGHTAREIAASDGFDTLHELELDVLRDSLARPEPAVIGAAASVVDTDVGAAMLEEPFVIFLRATPEPLAARLAASDKPHRPLDEDPLDDLRDQARRRYPVYTALADVIVDADVDHDAMAEAIRDKLIGVSTDATDG